MTLVRIRCAGPEDDAALVDLELQAWTAASGFPSVTARLLAERTFGRDPADWSDLLLAVEPSVGDAAAERLLGYVRLAVSVPVLEASRSFEIRGLAVHPAARGRGVARALLAAVEDEARRRGGLRLGLGVFGTNTPAIRLYESAGFALEGIQRGLFVIEGTPVDNLVMGKLL